MMHGMMGRAWRTLCGTAVALLAAGTADAWGPRGHAIVAELAQRQLTPVARAQVRRLLPNQSLASIASWADDIREERPETARWHYVRIPRDVQRYDPSRDCKILPAGDCAIAAIRRFTLALTDRSR